MIEPGADREKIILTGAPETMLATLYGRALDSRSPHPILHDRAADDAVRRIDYDFARTGMTATSGAGVALRARQLDRWTAQFLAAHPHATVLHLACGLDTRVQRLDLPPSVRWVDVDHPEVIAVRDRLLPAPAGDYRTVGASVTDDGWLDDVPADRPTVAVFEGLTMYLRKQDGRRLVERITGRFPTGQLLFDCYGSLGIRLQRFVPAVRNSGATLHWAIDDPRELESWHDGLECLDALRSVDMPGVEELPRSGRASMWVLARLPGFRDVGRILRYRF
ncbi:class I SAM-dependent methyltransferase [Pseudonocardia xinjiangensis]|uniref:Class I SAM-dependent methyltransferase n=1 Tax=Pseudonocardia xinjiangensis TaxID=75289 RepID=A0ABX1RD86_9PSEU|nr:class I SAM-dependent methyltransferase [Pseudonocardia xinjiangensis]NMH78343.1 class I SAM-dependent methyltransferase [Pseudonocardia xinjiangensis]